MQIQYPPELPIVERLDEIRAAITDNQVVVLCGETGSGKSTQLPKLCLDIGRGDGRLIGHTQPRRLAARSVAARVASELKQEVGQQVGYKVRFTDRVGPDTRIKLMTDGILLAELQHDRKLKAYDTLIIDEAHERSLNIDFLLGYLKELLQRRRDLKVIVTSATIDPQRFSGHFDSAPIIEVSGRTWPVEVRYRPPQEAVRGDRDEGMQQGIVEAVDELRTAGPGDVLVFLSGEREIRDTAEVLRRQHYQGTEILPLYARLSAGEQGRIFRPGGGRRIVLATNVAETSLTVPGIHYVVDTGYARISRFSHRSKIQRLPVEPVSQASADQRKGRCGRIAEGVCIRLYEEDDFNTRPRFTEPEILRTNLAAVILQMQVLGFGDIAHFPFVEPPERKQIKDGYRVLHEIGAVDERRRITRIGRQLARLPIDPRLGRMLLAAAKTGCLAEALVIVAGLSVQDPRERPLDKQQQADEAHALFSDESSDFITLLNLWQHLETERAGRSRRAFREHCRKRFLSWTRVQEWYDTHRQLRHQMQVLGHRENHEPADRKALHCAILSGLLSHIGFRQSGKDRDYLGARNTRFHVFPGSGLFARQPKWLVATELVETSRLYGRILASIEPEWVERLAGHLIKRSYSEPHWQARRGQVGAYERITLYGLTLIPRRRVNYGPIDPAISREIFIRSALVDGVFETRAPFWRHNRELIDELHALEAKSRRHDILVDEEAIFVFYDKRIPEGIYSKADFEKWVRAATAKEKYLLHMEQKDLSLRSADDVGAAAFPDHLDINGMRLPLSYRFAVGESDDGVTVRIPVGALGQITPGRADWLVPGLLREKIIALIKSLPKGLRRNFVPAPDFADRCLARMTPSDTPLVQVLGATLKAMTGVHVPEDAWATDTLPDHLSLRVAVVGKEGEVLDASRDLVNLRDLGDDVQAEAPDSSPTCDLERRGLKDWNFGDLPERVEMDHGGIRMPGFPALVDTGSAVDLRVFNAELDAGDAHQQGLRRLIALRLGKQQRDIRRALPDPDRLRLQLARPLSVHGSTAVDWSQWDLGEELLLLSIDRAFLSGVPAIREQAAFEQCLRNGRARLHDVTAEVGELVVAIAEKRQRLVTSVNATTQRNWQASVDDLRMQLDGLIYPGFLTEVPEPQLSSYPRYLQAAQLRLEKLPQQPDRDRQRMSEMAKLLQAWRSASTAATKRGQHDPRLEEIRWMLEELRVSLFAQELRTAYKISIKRVEKRWRELGF